MMRPTRSLALIAAALGSLVAADAPATVALIGPSGTMPPSTLGFNGYVNTGGVLKITDGLPPGTTVEIDAELKDFFNIVSAPDGMGGEILNFNGVLTFEMHGTGSLLGYTRFVSMLTTNQWHDEADGDPSPGVQDFDTDMLALQGQLPPGDPDFNLLRITAGTSFGMPSPGHTTLTQLPGGNWNVDSFFDVTYRIDFIGSPAGLLGGMSGSTTSTVRLQLGEPAPVPEVSPFALLAICGLATACWGALACGAGRRTAKASPGSPT